MFLYSSGPLTGLFSFNRPCRAARRAGVATHARHAPPGRANTGTVAIGPCRVWAGPKKTGFRAGFRAAGCMDIYSSNKRVII